jgi:hypothetical protein
MNEKNLMYGITSDTLLWNNFCSGDDKTFEIIYRTYIKTLFHYGSKFTKTGNSFLIVFRKSL